MRSRVKKYTPDGTFYSLSANSNQTMAAERPTKCMWMAWMFQCLYQREMYFDHNGRPITVSLKTTAKSFKTSLFDWMIFEQVEYFQIVKAVIIQKELEQQGCTDRCFAGGSKIRRMDLLTWSAMMLPTTTTTYEKERANNVKTQLFYKIWRTGKSSIGSIAG